MVKEATVQRAFSTEVKPDGVTLSVARSKPILIALAGLISVPAGIIAVIGLIGLERGGAGFLLAGVGTIVGLWVLALQKKTVSVRLTDEGVIRSNTLYRYRDIETVGHRNTQEGRIYNLKNVSDAAAHTASAYANYIYIIHGTREVVLIAGLQSTEVGVVYEEVKRIMMSKGFQFR